MHVRVVNYYLTILLPDICVSPSTWAIVFLFVADISTYNDGFVINSKIYNENENMETITIFISHPLLTVN